MLATFVVSTCQSVRVYCFSFHWTDLHDILYWRRLLKCVDKIQVCVCVCVYVCVCVCVCMYVCKYECIYVGMDMYTYIYIYIYMYEEVLISP